MRARAAVPIFLTAIGLAAAGVGQRQVYPGRVLDENGKGIAGATVTARWCDNQELPDLVGWTLGAPEDLGCPSVVVTSDDTGGFRFELPVRGPVALVARDASGERQSLRCFPVMSGDFRELRLRAAEFVAGRVIGADGGPLADRELVLEPERRSWARRAISACPTSRITLRTDANGRFRQALEHAWTAASMWEPLVVLRPAAAELGFGKEVIVLPLAQMAELELVASPRAALRGFLRDVAGVPLVGGRVYERHAPWRSVRTIAAGAFAVQAARVSDLGFVAAGHSPTGIPFEQGSLQLPADHGVGVIPCRRVAMRLVLGQGNPLPEHEVLWSIANGGEPPLEWLAKTDAEGRVTLDGPVLTTTSGFVRCEGHWRRFLRSRIARNEDLGDVAVKWRTLDGQVVDQDGVPCAGARVVAVEKDTSTPASPPFWVTYTDHGGGFRFPSLPQTPFTVNVEAGIRGLAQLAVDPDEGRCTLRLAAGVSVEVEVGDLNGVVPGCWVALTSNGGFPDPDSPWRRDNYASVFGVTDEHGVVLFRGLPDRDWRVIADRVHDGKREAGQGEVSGQERLRVELKPQGR